MRGWYNILFVQGLWLGVNWLGFGVFWGVAFSTGRG